MTRGDAFSFLVDASAAGERLDVFVGARLPGCSRSFAAQLIAGGNVRVNERPRKPGHRLKSGDAVSGCIPPPRPAGFPPEPIPLSILYEDEHIVVINKPPGLVVHPAPGHYSGTLVNALLYHCPDLGGIGSELRPGIVHRLDKDTSGSLVVAKNGAALEGLSAQFKARTVQKTYLALVHGAMPAAEGSIRLPIGRHPVDRKRMSVASRKTRAAETGWRVRRRFPGFTLLELDLKTGRTHQIRVHCAAVRHPIVGDPVYGKRRIGSRSPGDSSQSSETNALLANTRRQMLHAWRIGFVHPASGAALTFESPLPPDMRRLIAELEARSSRPEAES
jgi:23S rRNA pseudouridine1911/1915/1917 synthase